MYSEPLDYSYQYSSCSPGIFFTELGEEEWGDGGGEGEKWDF